MKRNILCVLFAGLILLTGFAIVKNKVFLYEKFYQNQSYEMFVATIHEYADEFLIEPDGSKLFGWSSNASAAAKADLIKVLQEMLKNRVDRMSLFEALVLRNHPEYIEPYKASYPAMGLYERAVFLRAMRSLGKGFGQEITIDNEKLYDLVADPQLAHISWVDNFVLQKDIDIDKMHYCFLATGDEKYVVKAVEYLQKRPMGEGMNSKHSFYQYGIPYGFKQRIESMIHSDPKYQDLREELFPSQ